MNAWNRCSKVFFKRFINRKVRVALKHVCMMDTGDNWRIKFKMQISKILEISTCVCTCSMCSRCLYKVWRRSDELITQSRYHLFKWWKTKMTTFNCILIFQEELLQLYIYPWKCKTSTVPILMHRMCISTNYVSSVMLRPKNLEIRNNVRTEKKTNKTNHHAMKWPQIHRRIEPCLRKMILCFEMDL
jgi:hypothetical protein